MIVRKSNKSMFKVSAVANLACLGTIKPTNINMEVVAKDEQEAQCILMAHLKIDRIDLKGVNWIRSI